MTLLHYWCLTDGLCEIECLAVCGSPSLGVPTVSRQFSRCTLLAFSSSSFSSFSLYRHIYMYFLDNGCIRSRDRPALFIVVKHARKDGKANSFFLRRQTNLSVIDNLSVSFYRFLSNAIESLQGHARACTFRDSAFLYFWFHINFKVYTYIWYHLEVSVNPTLYQNKTWTELYVSIECWSFLNLN